jgi:hypothetical protein
VRCEAGIRTDRVPFPIGLRAMAEAGRLVRVEPGWRSFFDDAESDIDWWIDPALVSGEAGTWYPDDALVFGVEVGGEAVAFPKNVMEVHELVNPSAQVGQGSAPRPHGDMNVGRSTGRSSPAIQPWPPQSTACYYACRLGTTRC